MTQTFDTATLASLRDTREVRIRTTRHKGRGIVIWIVVANDAAFVRSVRGPAGKWFVAAAADGQATLELNGRQLPVRVVPITDPPTIAAVSHAFLAKYATSPYAHHAAARSVLNTRIEYGLAAHPAANAGVIAAAPSSPTDPTPRRPLAPSRP
jgi:hypothetical protein